MTALIRYEAACKALAEAVSADEVMSVHTSARAIEAVARVAQNFDLELDAAKLRVRAETRLGEMLAEGEARGIIAARGGQRKQNEGSDSEPSPATLQEIGVDKKLSARARKLSGIGAQAVNAMLDRMERESRARGRLAVNVIEQELGKRNTATRRQLARELSDATAALSPTGRKFACLYADPAWRRKAGVGDRAYENSYATMDWQAILDMPVKDRLLPDAWGFLWIPRPHLLAAIEIETDTSLGLAKVKVPLSWAVMLKWGFDSYSTCFVWTKTDEEFPDDQGTGLIAYDQDELLLLFKRGRGLPKPDNDKKHGSNYRARSGRHSEKPAYYRDMINDMTDTVPTLELFAREDADHVLPANFFTWGNQSKNTAERPKPVTVADDGTPCDPNTGELPPNDAVPLPSASPEPAFIKPPVGAGSSNFDELEIPEFLRRKKEPEARP